MSQLELDFGNLGKRSESDSTWVHRFTNDALCIETEKWTFTFGLWDYLHGTWVTDRQTGLTTEIVHDWLPLNEIGTYRADKRPANAGDFYPIPRKWTDWCEISSAFVAYFNQIPARIRRVVGQLDGHQLLALDLIWQMPEFAWFLDEELASGRHHYFHACVELAGAERMHRRERCEFARQLMSEKRTKVLGDLIGVAQTKRSLRLLDKILDSEPWDAEWYQTLLSVASTSTGSKALSHSTSIDFIGLLVWLQLPELLRTSNLLRIFVNDSYEAKQFLARIENLFPYLSEEALQRMQDSLGTVNDNWTLMIWIETKLNDYFELIPFPSAPILGNRILTPLSSIQKMHREARKMRNCLASDIWGVCSGQRYYYHFDGFEPSTVLLERSDEDEWHFEEILGPGNSEVTRRTKLIVEAMVADQLPTKGPETSTPKSVSYKLLNGPSLANDNVPLPVTCLIQRDTAQLDYSFSRRAS